MAKLAIWVLVIFSSPSLVVCEANEDDDLAKILSLMDTFNNSSGTTTATAFMPPSTTPPPSAFMPPSTTPPPENFIPLKPQLFDDAPEKVIPPSTVQLQPSTTTQQPPHHEGLSSETSTTQVLWLNSSKFFLAGVQQDLLEIRYSVFYFYDFYNDHS
jgi:hypothetical protein